MLLIATIVIIVVDAAEYYSGHLQHEGYTYAVESGEQSVSVPKTEFFTFSPPKDYNEVKDAARLASVIRPQRVIFIRTPEKNIFSLTAEQLAKKESLNIFVLTRDTNVGGLLSQYKEIREQVGQKPTVHFVKYRTPEDIDRAKQAIYNNFEAIPGPSQYHEEINVPVHDFNAQSTETVEEPPAGNDSYESPVIFRIIRHISSKNSNENAVIDDNESPIIFKIIRHITPKDAENDKETIIDEKNKVKEYSEKSIQ